MYSSPRAQWVMTPIKFDCVPEGTNNAASKPSISATSASSALILGSSPNTSSPTGAAAIAARIAAVGRVTVSLRKSTGITAPSYRRSIYKFLENLVRQQKAAICETQPLGILHEQT